MTAASAPLNPAGNHYTMHFNKGDFPPVNAFWSVTLYDAKTKLLYAKSINRYLINSPMLPDLKIDPDGGLTIYLHDDPPENEHEALLCHEASRGPSLEGNTRGFTA